MIGPPTPGAHRGVVSAFDVERGLGTVAGDDGWDYPLHCVQIADGSRRIEIGTAVSFRPVARLGRWEAADVRPTDSAANRP